MRSCTLTCGPGLELASSSRSPAFRQITPARIPSAVILVVLRISASASTTSCWTSALARSWEAITLAVRLAYPAALAARAPLWSITYSATNRLWRARVAFLIVRGRRFVFVHFALVALTISLSSTPQKKEPGPSPPRGDKRAGLVCNGRPL